MNTEKTKQGNILKKTNDDRRDLTFVLFNARSLMNKLSELAVLVESEKPDVILITESWTNANIEDAEVCLSGYTMVRSDKEGTRGGGCILYCREELKAIIVPNSINSKMTGVQSIWIKLKLDSEVRIGLIYRSPNSTEEETDMMMREIELMSEIKEHVLVCGDFNFPHINWNTLQADKLGQKFVDCVHDCYFQQLVKEPTRENNILDLVLSSDSDKISQIRTDCPFGSSDHRQVKFRLNAPRDVSVWNRQFLNYRKGKYKQFRKFLSQYDWDVILGSGGVENIWTKFKSILLLGVDKFIPKCVRSTRRTKPQWLSKSVMRANMKKRNSWKQYRDSRTEQRWMVYKKHLKISNKVINGINGN